MWVDHLYLFGMEFNLSTADLEDLKVLGTPTVLLELSQSEGSKHYVNQTVRVEIGVDDKVLSHDGILEIHTERDGGILTVASATIAGNDVMRPTWR